MALENLKGLIFDVHRTLVDDSGFPRERICQLIQQSGIKLDLNEYYSLYDNLTRRYFNWNEITPFITIRKIHERRLKEIYQYYGVKRDLVNDINYLWQCMGTSKIYSEVSGVLKQISNIYKIGLLSNADNDDPLIELLLKNGFSFDAIVTSHHQKKYKPDPELFMIMLKKLKLKKDQVLLIGDSPQSDIVGARNVGIKVVWINRKGIHLNPSFPSPDYQISDLTQLLNIIQN